MKWLLTCLFLSGILTTAQAQIEVRGAVEGEWTVENSPYLVVGNISLAANQDLTIEPGVWVLFTRGAMFEARGRLTAVGTEEDSIYFAWREEGEYWRGLRMFNASPESRISFCVFMGSTSQGDWQQESSRGGALYLRNTNIEISHCLFTLNVSTGEGAGIHAYECSPLINSNVFDRNHSDLNAAAVCLRFSNSIVSDNLMIHGTTSWGPGGMIIWDSNPTIERNYIMYNSSNLDWGCGIYIADRCNPVIRNNVIVKNDGGAIYAGPSMNVINFDNNTIAFNTGRCGILLYSSTTLTLRNCILWHNGDMEMWCHVACAAFAEYCDILNVDNEDIEQRDGVIDLDPLFVNADEDDYHLSPDSPCIDAGDPEFGRDPDGTICDIGALPFEFGEGDAALDYEPHELVVDQSGEYVINLANVGEVDLWFRCSLVCEWAIVDPLNGVVVPEGDVDIFVTIDAEDLEIGVYQTVLRLVTNVRAQRMFEIPISLSVEAGDAPQFQNLPANFRCQETDTLRIALNAVDPDGDQVSLHFQSDDVEENFNFIDRGNGTGLFEWVTTYDDAGVYQATFIARDEFWTTRRNVQIIVENLNRPPIVLDSLAEIQILEDSPPIIVGRVQQIFRDPDQEILQFEVAVGPGIECWITEIGNVVCQPLRNFNGISWLSVTASDSIDAVSDTAGVTVLSVNDPPSRFDLVSPAEEARVDSYPNVVFAWRASVDVVEDSAVTYAIGFFFERQSRWFYGLSDTAFSAPRQIFALDPNAGADVQWQVWANDGTDSVACNRAFNCHIEPLSLDPTGKPLPREYKLYEPFPNPFNSELQIHYDLPRESRLRLALFDVNGKEITRLVDGVETAGSREVSLSGANLPAGVYIIRMEAPERVFLKKAMLVK